ncbi:hypothetical protein P153DRAFT_387792 [Dothidotthia symphoricarpi CBS 119687]|uniref:Uncharacterized protein n=1 Tax=Dothidotthia symphoricarpi CBS 119687 TaxID=1392245 RepID=A0A6A6A6Q8_9PLEO|nr:uncharacterized protein P153DRAFT_387792 [Dothidotthia symphoricarpi CBS 119687]KAF2127246.1 hypothetical protein P153DRAFT_387792 [Dothidotthia symphoricarpi CBS 119687]
MPRTIELGRAVLSSPATNLELWLTTLITISPQQDSTNIDQFSSASLLVLLSSGDVWVGRGNGLHIDLHLTLRGEPLAHRQLQELANNIVKAPVWEQLKLRPSIPADAMQTNRTLIINIGHSDDGSSETKAPHRVLSNVPAADVRPPEGVPKISLDRVRFLMEIFETKQRLQPTRPKRVKMIPGGNIVTFSSLSIFGPDHNNESDDILVEPSPAASLLQRESLTSTCLPVASLVKRKRKRSSTYMDLKPAASSLHDPTHDRPPPTSSNLRSSTLAETNDSDLVGIEVMIDGALRLSASGSLSTRSSNGVKIKANTFSQSLMEVAPILWSPGYLLALSQRAQLLSVVSRSLTQTAYLRATSMSLKDKVAKLVLDRATVGWSDAATVEPSVGQLSSTLASRLWLYLQKNLECKSTPGLQAFVVSKQQNTSSADQERSGQKKGLRRISRSAIDMNESGDSEDDELLHEVNHAFRTGDGESPLQGLVPVITEHDRQDSGVVEDDMLLHTNTESAVPRACINLCAGGDVVAPHPEVASSHFYEDAVTNVQYSLGSCQPSETSSSVLGPKTLPIFAGGKRSWDTQLVSDNYGEEDGEWAVEKLVPAF